MTENKFATYYPIAYRFLFAILIVGMSVMNVGYIAGIPQVGKSNWLVIGVTLFLLTCLNYGKFGLKIISSILLLSEVFVLIPLLSGGQFFDFYVDYIKWMFQSGEYNSQWKQGYQLMQTAWVSIGCYIFQIITEYKARLKDLTALGVAVGLVVGLVLEERLPSVGVAFLVVYIMLWYVEIIRKGWNKKTQRDMKEYTLFLLPYFAAFTLLLTYLPTSTEPYAWPTVQKVYQRVYEKVTTWWEKNNREGFEDFGGPIAGFSDDGRLLGRFARDEKKLMTVSGDVRLQMNLYLRGITYDTFNGREWFKTLEENKEEYPLDTIETYYAIRRHNGSRQGDYICVQNAKVRYDFFSTEVLFTPLKLSQVKYDSYSIQGRDFKLEDIKTYGTEYELKYYQLNQNTPEFRELMEAELPEDEEVWNNEVDSFGEIFKRSYTLEDLMEYRRSMKEGYWQQVNMSDELKLYLEQVTYGCETKYQKMRAIEKELSGYIYNKSPGKIPGKVQSQEDFLEYLLLETREGFCAHYATAFVLLARAEGLPARFVEGFCVPVTANKEMDVYSGQAHAWPEVYFEGVGWIAFEPTPGYAEVFYDGWEIAKPEDEQEEEKEEIVKATPSPQQELSQSIMEDIEKKRLEQEKIKSRERGRLVLKCIGWSFLICVLVLLVERIYRRERYKKMTIEGKFLVEVKRNLWIFARLGYRREDADTLSELQDRIRQDIPGLFVNKNRLQMFKAYEEYLYRTKEVTRDVLKETIEERKELLGIVKEEDKGHYYMLKVMMWLSLVQ